ncbi:lipid A export permease/ATP-binding protein MsbA [Alkalimonas sp. MEB108]|uniref:Lipid A export permease/ATP-binding protein MsbA n=1 Tax=Alkalimonas cellulosilytica TaxID=3058395 RepID=A0ABU7J4N0_9GAMM|nr:lipid A export permease/ATP-binding protein MsbA [Alkalimonas sp. MEB108]MEE2001463.1 lipid A export permease/ATP-binding protein MsbA [Alkalimonas sp. MEB108]
MHISDVSNKTSRRLLGYLKPYRPGFVVALLGMVGYALVDVGFISMLQPFIDDGIEGKDADFLKYAPLFIIVMFVFRGASHFIATYCLSWVGANIVKDMRQQLFEHLMRLPVSFHDKHSTGDLISKITYDTEQLKQATSKALIVLIREGAFVLGLIALMFWHSWQLSLIFLLIAPIIAVIVGFVSKRFRKISNHIQTAMGQVTTCSEQMLNGHKVILSFGGQAIEKERFATVNNTTRQQDVKLESAKAMSTGVVQLIASFALAFVIFLASQPAMLDSLTAGKFTLIVSSMVMLLRPLKQLTTVNGDFQRGLAAAKSIFRILDQVPEQDTGNKELGRISGHIRFDHVDFSYPGHEEKQVLKDISFEVKPGETLALVGRSGSGKTTISSLLPRFYEIEKGRILLDDISIKSCTLSSLRSQMAIVSQHVTLFNDSIANNIMYGLAEPVSEERLLEVAEKAHVLEFSSQMKDGLNTLIGENGVSLSGGQRQRIAIARALLRQAPILILDEATSALDTESERKIQAALDELLKGRTNIVIAHRLSTIENADQILVMEQGQIIERGNHQSLLAKDGAYAQLYKMQFGSKPA